MPAERTEAAVDLAPRNLHWSTNWICNGQSLNSTPNNYIDTVETEYSWQGGGEVLKGPELAASIWASDGYVSHCRVESRRLESFIFYLKTQWTNLSGYLTGKLSRVLASKKPNSYSYLAATNHSPFHPLGSLFRSLTGFKASLRIYASKSSLPSKPGHREPPTAVSPGCGYSRNR